MPDYIQPVPGGTIGREDQGVDISAPPGTPIVAIADSTVVGIIQNWFKGQPFVWFRDKFGQYWYGAEQFDPSVHIGQRVRQGQRIGTVARSGTGLEFGWATKTGRTRAKATTGYKEGQVTAAGKDFNARVIRGSKSAALHFKPCLLTWYDPALGGTNSASGARDAHAATASGEAYNANDYTCAAPSNYAFGTRIMFRYGGRSVTCRVNDRGGAIVGSHFDLSRRAADALGITHKGSARAEFAVTSDPTGGNGVTRPGADTGGDDGLDAMLTSFFQEGDQFTGTMQDAATRNVDFQLPFGLPSIPLPGPNFGLPIPGLPGIPNIPGLPHIDPLDPLHSTENAIKDTVSFLKFIAWILHPRHILQVVEFITGLTIMGVSVHVAIEHHRNPGQQSSVRRATREAVQLTPVGRSLRVARGARAGRTASRAESRRKDYNTARKRARTKETGRQKRRTGARNTRSIYGDTPPF